MGLVSWQVFCPCKGYKGEGPVSIASANVTSCLKHSTRIATLGIDNLHCICMQESRIPESKVRQLSRKFDGYGWELISGPQPPVKKLHGRSSGFRQTTGGVAALVRKGYGCTAVDIQGSFASIRACCQVLFLPFQQTGCYVINVYLPSGGQAVRSRNELMESIFCYAASLGNVPVMICGDFQSKPEDNSAILHAFITDEWFDVHAERQKLLGKQPEHTFVRSNSSDADDKGKSRIDFFLFNKHLLPFFSSSGVLLKSGLPNHRPCFVEVSVAKVTSTVHVAKPHPKWKFNDSIPQSKQQWVDRDILVQPILQSAAPSLIQAAESCDTEALWTIACETVTKCLNKISGQSLPATRGRLPSFKAVPLARPDHQSKLANSVTPLLKRLHELRKKANLWTPLSSQQWLNELHATLRNASRLAAKLGITLSFKHATPEELAASCDEAYNLVVQHVDDQECKLRQDAISVWKHKLQQSANGSKSKVFRWLRNERVGSPRFFAKDDGSIVTDPNDMLDMISSYMEGIYNHHEGKDFEAMVTSFYEKYQGIIDGLHQHVELSPITPQALFDLFKKKSPEKASGLDGWQVRELQQLPPQAWMPFSLVMKLAEATGKWPQAIKMISIASISKGEDMTSPEKVRCIGVASVLYALWSSLRFKNLSQWQAVICPPSLIGGLTQRNADESEWQLSMDLHNDESDTLAVFLDRFKCFDMVIPEVSLGIAKRLGLPQQVYQAALGFYSEQVKLFKLGTAFGRKVFSSNSAVQGCSLSVLMVNVVYSVFAAHVQRIVPNVSFRSFIDDAKMWTAKEAVDDLARAFDDVDAFDQDIGQVANPRKTFVVTRKKSIARRFLKKVGKQFQVKRNIQSLGFSHACQNRGGANTQNQRIDKACAKMHKIKQLPINRRRKCFFVHSAGHSQWVYGSEVQAPSLRKLHGLRSSVVSVLFKKNRVRSPFLALATFYDVFVDPFGKWALHCFSKLRKMSRLNPQLASDVLCKAKTLQGTVKPLHNGVAAVFAYLCNELEFVISNASSFILESKSWGEMCLCEGSNQRFRDFLDTAIRKYLLKKAAKRHDCNIDANIPDVEPFLTRFLFDSDFRTDCNFELLKPYLQRLPKDHRYTKAVLETILTGAIYTGPRLKASGLTDTDECSCSAAIENHQHLFLECSLYDETRPRRGSEHLLTWFTGIFLVPDELQDSQLNHGSLVSFPAQGERFAVETEVFVDGSAFHERWRLLRTSAAAVVIPGQFEKASLLPGNDHTSQRAELYAVVWALKLTFGPLRIYSDCASVVDRALSLKSAGYRLDDARNFDNYDLWCEFLKEASRENGRNVVVVKVKAHVSSDFEGQPQWMTEGNAAADRLAKATAKQAFLSKLNLVTPFLHRAVDIQSHLVATLVARKEHSCSSWDPAGEEGAEPFKELRISSCCCSCSPVSRARGKTSVCRGGCDTHRLGVLEDAFQKAVARGSVPPDVANRIWTLHPSFKASVQFVGVLCAPVLPQECVGIRLRGCLVSSGLCTAMGEFITDGQWKWGTKNSTDRTSWVVLCGDFVAKYGLFSGFIHRSMSFGVVLRRFRDLFLQVLAQHHVKVDVVSGLRHAKTLGFGSLGGVSAARNCSAPLQILSWCLSISKQLHNLNSKFRAKPFTSLVPSWDELL